MGTRHEDHMSAHPNGPNDDLGKYRGPSEKTDTNQLVLGRVVPAQGKPFPISDADRKAEKAILDELVERCQAERRFSDALDPTSQNMMEGGCVQEGFPELPNPLQDEPFTPISVNPHPELDETLGQGADGGGQRLNAGKNRIELLPPEWLWALADVMTQGSKKYDARNWEKGMDWSSMIGCMYRHIAKFQAGQRYDGKEFDKKLGTTGCHELAMVAWNALALMVYDIRNIGNNDLPVLEQLDLFNDVNAATSTLEQRWEHDRLTPPEPNSK